MSVIRRFPHRARRKPVLEFLEARLALSGILNGNFSISDPADASFGYALRGRATVAGGQGILNEGFAVQSGIAQTFSILPGAKTLQFTVVTSALAANGGANPPDAFEVALLNAGTGQPLIGPPTGLGKTDAFLNVQSTGEVFFAPKVTVPGVATSGQVASITFPIVVTVDVSGVAANTQATLSFDLIGFGSASSVVTIDDLVQVVPAAPLLTLGLDPASDSGVVGDGLTRFNPVTLLGQTNPAQQVVLDLDGDGFDDGTTTADAIGQYRFENVTLAESQNALRVQATNGSGTSGASLSVTVDTQAPTGILASPVAGSSPDQLPGYIEVQWTDPGAAGLDLTSFGIGDVTISGVDVDSFQDLGGGRVRYRYDLDGERLPKGPVTVTLVAGQVRDRAGNSNPQSVQGFIAPNTAPTGAADAYSTDEDVPLVIVAPGVLGNDTDVDGDPLKVVLVTGPEHGQLAIAEDGSFSYTPSANYNGSDGFTYRVSDGSAGSAVTTVIITVRPVNDAPVARPDAYTMRAGNTLTVNSTTGLLLNDNDVDGDALTAELLQGPPQGTLTLNDDGSFSYTPAPGFRGSASFTYRASDGRLTSSAATVTIDVQNNPPVAVDDAATTERNVLVAIDVISNDSDLDGDALLVEILTQPARGQLTLNPDGMVTYTPNPESSGIDRFSYRVRDGQANSAPATVKVTVLRPNRVPSALPDSTSTLAGRPVTIHVLANDTDPDGDPLAPEIDVIPSHGSVAVNADGRVTYSPEAGFRGSDSFTYHVTDNLDQSPSVSVTILVQNNPPVVRPDSATTRAGTPATIEVLANDSDADGDLLIPTIASAPGHGVAMVQVDGTVLYTPTTGFHGTDRFTYKVTDGLDTTDSVEVTISVANSPPVAAPDAAETDEDVPVTIDVLSNDSDPDGDRLTTAIATQPTHGTLATNADGTFSYSPAPDYHGTDSFTYRVSDGQDTSPPVTVTLAIRPVNDPPVARDDEFFVAADQALSIGLAAGVLANDSDGDGDALTAAVLTNPQHGTLQLSLDGSFTYQPAGGFRGSDSFTYRARDASLEGATATVTIRVGPPDPAPDAADDQYISPRRGPLNVPSPGVLANDADPAGQTLTAILVTPPEKGMLELNPDGSFSYAASPGATGTDHFTYQASDGNQRSRVATVTLTIAANQSPRVSSDTYKIVQGSPLVIATPGVLGNDSDPDGDPLTTELVTPPSHGVLTLNLDGSFRYVPNTSFSGSDSFRYRASDGTATSEVVTVSLTVDSCPPLGRLLPTTPFFNRLRTRRASDPDRFDANHPRVGPLLGLESNGIPSGPVRLLPKSMRFDGLRAQRVQGPTWFDQVHPVIGAIIRLEQGTDPATTYRFLPHLPREALVRSHYAFNASRFGRYHPYLGALLNLESSRDC